MSSASLRPPWGSLHVWKASSVPKAAELEVLILKLLQRRGKVRNVTHLWLRVSKCSLSVSKANCDSDEPMLPSVTSSNYRKYQVLLVYTDLWNDICIILCLYCRISNSSVPYFDRGVNDQSMTANTSIVGQGGRWVERLWLELEFSFHIYGRWSEKTVETKTKTKQNKTKQNKKLQFPW